MDRVLEVKNLNKSYSRFALKDVSFSLPEGCITGFIGINGAGKTTTLRSILGLVKDVTGSIRFFGMDMKRNEKQIKNRIGVVLDGDCFYEDLSLEEMKKILAPAYSSWCEQDYRSYLERFSLNPKEKIKSLSRGMKVKYALALALSHKAELLIMDEPTSGLDPLIQQAFYDILKEENNRGTTIFFSSHVLSEVQKLCDRVAILKEGKLMSIQSIRELWESGYKKVSLTTKTPISSDFWELPGIANFSETPDKTSVSFMYNGNITAIIDKLHLLHLDDVLLEEPSLEEIFMHYYA